MTRIKINCTLNGCNAENFTTLEHVKENELVFCDTCCKAFNGLQAEYELAPYEEEEPPPVPEDDKADFEVIKYEYAEPVVEGGYPPIPKVDLQDWSNYADQDDYCLGWIDDQEEDEDLF